jgi:hypothetical protein
VLRKGRKYIYFFGGEDCCEQKGGGVGFGLIWRPMKREEKKEEIVKGKGENTEDKREIEIKSFNSMEKGQK